MFCYLLGRGSAGSPLLIVIYRSERLLRTTAASFEKLREDVSLNQCWAFRESLPFSLVSIDSAKEVKGETTLGNARVITTDR